MEWLSPKLRLPNVVGYLILGLLLGPQIFNIVPDEFLKNSNAIIDLSLSIIAVLVGATLKYSSLKKHAKEVVYITFFQAIITFVVVSIGFIFIGSLLSLSTQESILIALFLGAIASATDSAAPIAIVHELKAKGKFTSTYLAIVAADDAISLIIFSIALSIGITLTGNEIFNYNHILDAFLLILFSSLIGITTAITNTMLEKLLKNHKGMETLTTLGLVFITYSLSKHFELEPLLSAMVMGAVMTNTSPDFDLVHEEIDGHLIEIIFMLFFVISAMYLKLNDISSITILIIAFIGLRIFGKVFGSYLGASISKSTKNIKKYMGLALIPQAGVAIGLALSLQERAEFTNIAEIILNVVIATTLIHELIGPITTKYILEKVKESSTCKS